MAHLRFPNTFKVSPILLYKLKASCIHVVILTDPFPPCAIHTHLGVVGTLPPSNDRDLDYVFTFERLNDEEIDQALVLRKFSTEMARYVYTYVS